MRRFFTPQSFHGHSQLLLEEQLVHYLVQVLRLKVGAQICLFNGQESYRATLIEVSKKQVSAQLEEPVPSIPASPLNTHLGQAISKGDKMDWVIQKACELGVTSITPLYTHKGDVRLKPEREAKKLAQWQQIAISACEQNGRLDIPLIHPAAQLSSWLANRNEELRLVLHPEGNSKKLSQLPPPASVALLIGPEGGLSSTEVEQATQQGFYSLTLGPRILRTETAPITALSLVQFLWGDLENKHD